MGKRLKKTPQSKQKVPMAFRERKVDKNGRLKRKKGDIRMVNSKKVGFEVKQKKGGKWVRSGERKCHIHTICNCVTRTDPAKMARIHNR